MSPKMHAIRRGALWGVALLLLSATGLFLAGPILVSSPPMPAVAVPGMDDLDTFVRKSESALGTVVPGREKLIQWADPGRRQRTPLALVYLHGFTACREEISPVVEAVASNLSANAFFTRLTGHGLTNSSEALAGATVEDWYRDAAEAIAIGQRLGDRVVLVATSTGATLGVPFLLQDTNIAAAVFISPNYGPRDARAKWLCGPFGSLWGRLMSGPYNEMRTSSDDERAYWTYRHRIGAVIPMMNLVHIVSRLDLGKIHCPVLTFCTPHDDTVNVLRIRTRSAAIRSPGSRLVEMPDIRNHVMAGWIRSPEGIAPVEKEILQFLRELAPPPQPAAGR
jgi:pimeloyl-ACP methyl ester carboxylesterase